jgi:hypothetical protein
MNNKEYENENVEEEEQGAFSNVMNYEELMESRKITILDVKEHMTGPALSTLIHVVLLVLLGTVVVFKAPEQAKEITVEMKTIEPQEIEPPPPPPEPPDPVETDNVVDDVPVQSPDMEVEIDVQVENISVESPQEIELPNVLNLKMSNSALTLAVPVGGGHGRRGGGKIGGFGYGKKAEGDLSGVMYDLKTKPNGSARPEYNDGKYWEDVHSYIKSGFNYSPSLGYREMNKKLYLSHLYIPRLAASEGPKQFGLEKDMKPSGFFIHYSGFIYAQKPFRFVGHGDDLLLVFIDKKLVIDCSWVDGSWQNSFLPATWHSPEKDKYRVFTGQYILFGDWVNAGSHKIDILYGERPGGMISGILLTQEKDKTYPTLEDGRPLLPIFTTMKLNKDEKARVEAEPWKITTDGPTYGAAAKKVKKEKAVIGLKIE